MLQYKTVPGPQIMTISKKGDEAAAVAQFADVINREAAQGWKLVTIEELSVEKSNGCIASLQGNPVTRISYKMLIFSREV
jgi:hypothetical protein